ncbi:uncharacterized protein LOC124281872 [Haliotis rubra]|uniref:uncharacterized protein LOC124281869 n=1 Tax=Haliotis rubra TaxID=36100 RepID=UPI001EE517D4|nr:uncharacterized protein LOC124281869 [Haliotis rubra]XP_046573840.1 uncharacterized protein LOC124281870 [Haliotis rubra]XP_046573843.1 uncharacterized protein LOC124281872 [Haliotis rubra]
MADFVTPVDGAFDVSSGIGAPQHTSTPLPKRRAVPSLTIPVPDTNHHVPTLSSLHPMSSPSYLHPTCISSPYSFFPSYSAMYYSPSFGPGTCTAPSYPLLPSPSFLPPSPSYLSSHPLGYSTVPGSPSFLPGTIPSSSLPIKPVSIPTTSALTTPTQGHSKSVDISPVTETRPIDFELPSCSRPDIGKAVDDIVAKTLGADLATKSTNNDRQSALEKRLQSLKSRFPTEVKELSSFLAFHSSSIQKEHQQCLQDGFFPTDYHNWLTTRYNDQLHLVFTSIEKSVTTLENQGKILARPASRNLSPESIVLMEKWYHEHLNNPYPTQTEAEDMANKGGITLSQVRKWFSNKRHRTRKPRSVKAVVAAKQCEEFLSGIFQM